MSVSYDKRLGLTSDGKGIEPCCRGMDLAAIGGHAYVAKGKIALRLGDERVGRVIACCPYCKAVAPGGEQ